MKGLHTFRFSGYAVCGEGFKCCGQGGGALLCVGFANNEVINIVKYVVNPTLANDPFKQLQ